MNFSKLDKRKALKIFISLEIICIGIAIGEWIYIQKVNVTKLDRPSYGEGTDTEELEINIDGYKEDYQVEITEQALSNSQESKYIEAAKKEIDKTFKGDNGSLENVTTNLVMKEEYQNGAVEADWYFDNYKVVTADGEIVYENVKKATVVNAYVTLTCQDASEVYEFAFVVKPLSKTSKTGIKYYISKLIVDSDDSKKVLTLPTSLGGKKIVWKRKYSFLGVKLGLLFLVAFFAIKLAQKYEVKSEQKRKQDQMKRDYPKIVESLSLYVAAGLSVKNSFFRISEEYVKSGQKSAGFEGLVKMCKSIKDGRAEIEAYKALPSICPIKEFRKLSLILISNVKKGTKGLIETLEQEEIESFEAQKQYVKILGEEASTKLLIPMVGLLGIVLVIVIVPAMSNMNF